MHKTALLSNAIDATKLTLNERSMYFRFLMIGVVFTIIFFSLILLFQSINILFVLPILLIYCGIFIYLDHRSVSRWQNHVLSWWERNEICLKILSSALLAMPQLPVKTIQGMISKTPINLEPEIFKHDHQSLRTGIVLTLTTINGYQSGQILVHTYAYAFGIFALIIITLIQFSYYLLLGAVLAFSLPKVYRHCCFFVFYFWRQKIHALLNNNHDIKIFAEFVSRIDWHPVDDQMRNELITSLINDKQ